MAARWEYVVVTLYGEMATQLNELGRAGWELVQATHGRSDFGIDCVFKRPSQEPSK